MKLFKCFFFWVVFLSSISVFSKPPATSTSQNQKAGILDNDSWIDANNVFMFGSNSGWFAYDQGAYFGRYDGCYFPYTSEQDITNGLTYSVVFAAGIWIGGTDSTTGDTLITAADYFTDFWPGPMVSGSYIANADSDLEYRVYKLYSDSLENNPNLDYLEWPAAQGAPADGDGNPKLTGDQTLWSVYNDANYGIRGSLPGSDSGMGIEIQSTLWATDTTGPEGMSIHSKYRLINKGSKTLNNLFICLWFDPDLGSVDNDLVGCDTLDDIFYCYNAGSDANYGSAPPAVGGKLIQGPIVPSLGDTAVVDSTPVPDFKNLDMYSFGRFFDGLDPFSYDWAYQYMNGLDASQGGIPYSNGTRFAVPGDPVAGTGDLDTNASDRRMMTSFGPLTFRPNDTQQIIVKLAVGQGTSALTSITDLKNNLNYVPGPGSCCIGIRGDVDGNGTDNNILDLNYMVNDIFRGGPPSPCSLEADIDSNGTPSTILDLNFLVNDIFRGGPSPGPC